MSVLDTLITVLDTLITVLDTLITVLDTLITVSSSRLPLASGVSFFTRKTPASVFLVLAMPLRSEKGTT